METTRVFECPECHAEIIEPRLGPQETPGRSGEFAAVVLECPNCGAAAKYDVGTAEGDESPTSAVIPCHACGTVVEAYGVTSEFVEHVASHPGLHDLHRR